MLGARLVAVGARARHGTGLLRVAEPRLRKLRDATGHTLHLAARQGDEMIYFAKLDGQRAY